ncbi:ArsR/SmtB family transcription factor [Cumulibacter manganitolerans]|uniref:ArsR/SmtB family transcription factor n=1 Tax=Cumulibacter manganitolerans TaxID=1884992 RepID=UPI00129535DC|nr:metalloregulator ArsR/SmtB family transcription factor [Cumulibacter manganitolerans]
MTRGPAWEALTDPTRRAIVRRLATGERTAGELAELFQIARPGVSRHLRVLREHGVVTVRADGQRRIYRLRLEAISGIERWCGEVVSLARTSLGERGTGAPAREASGKGRQMMDGLLGVLRNGTAGSAVATFDRVYHVGVDDLWAAITDPERLGGWFARLDGDLHERGHFTIHRHNGDVGNCHVLECSAPRRFSFEWPTPTETLVTVTVMPDRSDTRIELRHENLTPTQAPDLAAGWDAYLHTLDDYLSDRPLRDWHSSFDSVRAGYRAQLPL